MTQLTKEMEQKFEEAFRPPTMEEITQMMANAKFSSGISVKSILRIMERKDYRRAYYTLRELARKTFAELEMIMQAAERLEGDNAPNWDSIYTKAEYLRNYFEFEEM